MAVGSRPFCPNGIRMCTALHPIGRLSINRQQFVPSNHQQLPQRLLTMFAIPPVSCTSSTVIFERDSRCCCGSSSSLTSLLRGLYDSSSSLLHHICSNSAAELAASPPLVNLKSSYHNNSSSVPMIWYAVQQQHLQQELQFCMQLLTSAATAAAAENFDIGWQSSARAVVQSTSSQRLHLGCSLWGMHSQSALQQLVTGSTGTLMSFLQFGTLAKREQRAMETRFVSGGTVKLCVIFGSWATLIVHLII